MVPPLLPSSHQIQQKDIPPDLLFLIDLDAVEDRTGIWEKRHIEIADLLQQRKDRAQVSNLKIAKYAAKISELA
jgi:hypothetical protein